MECSSVVSNQEAIDEIDRDCIGFIVHLRGGNRR
jgi:hypothetical protein